MSLFAFYVHLRTLNIYQSRHLYEEIDHKPKVTLADWAVSEEILRQRLYEYRYLGEAIDIGKPVNNASLIDLIRKYRLKESNYIVSMEARGVSDVEALLREVEEMPAGTIEEANAQRLQIMKLLPFTAGREQVHRTMGSLYSREIHMTLCGSLCLCIFILLCGTILGVFMNDFADGNICKAGATKLPRVCPTTEVSCPSDELRLSPEYADLSLDGSVCTYLQDMAVAARDPDCETRWFAVSDVFCTARFPWDTLTYEKVLMQTLKSDVEGWERPSSQIVKVPLQKVPLDEKILFSFHADDSNSSIRWIIPIQDEDQRLDTVAMTQHTLVQDMITRSPAIFPLKDLGLQWGKSGDTPEKRADAGRNIIKILMSGNQQPAGSSAALKTGKFGSHVPAFMLREGWTDVTSDETLARFMFAGMGINHVEPVQAGTTQRRELEESGYEVPPRAAFVSDFSFMSLLETRPTFEQYGAIAYFDAAAVLLEIFWCDGGQQGAAAPQPCHKTGKTGELIAFAAM
eukprot:SAG31_NODE_1173_length_9543_cov_8.654913_7_plen_515_part_00